MSWKQILIWLFPCDRKGCHNGCQCGKGETTVTYPTTPPQPSTAEAINAWVQSMPTVFAEQQRQAPLQTQQQLQMIRDYGVPLGLATQAIDRALNPETSRLQESMATQANQGISATTMPEWMRRQYLSDYNAELGTNAGSPIGADYISKGMQRQLFEQQKYYRDLGLSLAGRQPLTTAAQAQPQFNNYTSTFTPGSVMNYTQQGYGTYAQAARPIALQDTRKYGLGWLLSM